MKKQCLLLGFVQPPRCRLVLCLPQGFVLRPLHLRQSSMKLIKRAAALCTTDSSLRCLVPAAGLHTADGGRKWSPLLRLITRVAALCTTDNEDAWLRLPQGFMLRLPQ